MSKSNSVREVIITRSARERLTSEEICQALSRHRPKKGVSTFRSESGHAILVVTEDARTRVMLYKP